MSNQTSEHTLGQGVEPQKGAASKTTANNITSGKLDPHSYLGRAPTGIQTGAAASKDAQADNQGDNQGGETGLAEQAANGKRAGKGP